MGFIKRDLHRRDFTINAMAIALNPERFGTLADFYNSQNDLMAHRIQVLHNLSFVEDPTRIYRAIRLESRLGFHITRNSERLIRNAIRLGLPRQIEGLRCLHELHHPIVGTMVLHVGFEGLPSLGPVGHIEHQHARLPPHAADEDLFVKIDLIITKS